MDITRILCESLAGDKPHRIKTLLMCIACFPPTMATNTSEAFIFSSPLHLSKSQGLCLQNTRTYFSVYHCLLLPLSLSSTLSLLPHLLRTSLTPTVPRGESETPGCCMLGSCWVSGFISSSRHSYSCDSASRYLERGWVAAAWSLCANERAACSVARTLSLAPHS